MKLLEINERVVNFEQKKMEDIKTLSVVASTKTENSLIEDLRNQGKMIVNYKTKDLFLDKAKTEENIFSFVATQIDNKEIAEMVAKHCIEMLDRGCVFYRPINRK